MGNILKGKVAVVTGSGRGIGRAEALALAAEGAKVVVNDIGAALDGIGMSRTPAEEVTEEIRRLGGEALANYDSVATPEGGDNIIKAAVGNFGRVDIVVNNAGIIRDRMIFNMSEEEWDAVVRVHLYGAFHVTKPACVYFRQQQAGRIINTASLSGFGHVGQANYSAAKEGIIGFTKTVATDMGRYHVTCNAIRPIARTRMALPSEPQVSRKQHHPQGKAVATDDLNTAEVQATSTPEMIAPLVVWLATDEAANINGCVFLVGGGTIGIYREPEIIASISENGKIWSLKELLDLMPEKVTRGVVNPAQPSA